MCVLREVTPTDAYLLGGVIVYMDTPTPYSVAQGRCLTQCRRNKILFMQSVKIYQNHGFHY